MMKLVKNLPYLVKDKVLTYLIEEAVGTMRFTWMTKDRTLHVDASEIMKTSCGSVMEEIDRLNHGVCGIPMMKRIFINCTEPGVRYRDACGRQCQLYECLYWNMDMDMDPVMFKKIVLVYHGDWFNN